MSAPRSSATQRAAPWASVTAGQRLQRELLQQLEVEGAEQLERVAEEALVVDGRSVRALPWLEPGLALEDPLGRAAHGDAGEVGRRP